MNILSSKKMLLAGAGVAALAVISGVVWYLNAGGKSSASTLTVGRADLTEVVQANGVVTPVKNADLAFQVSGRVVSVLQDVGASVTAGQWLVMLDSSDLNAQLDKANADLEAQQATLAKDRTDLANQYDTILTTLNDVFAKANDAVRNQGDNLFTNPESDQPLLNFKTSDFQAQNEVQTGRLLMQTELSTWRSDIAGLANASTSTLYASLSPTRQHLVNVQNFIGALSDAMNKYYGLTQAQADADKTLISAATTEVNAALSELDGQKRSIDAGTAAIASQQSTVDSYAANIATIQAQIAKTIIRSPINGVVSRQDAKVGQIVTPNVPLVSVISSSAFQIEVPVAETDVAKVKVGNAAQITLDAYGSGVVFDATVSKVDPAATIVNGVSQYTVTVVFTNPDSRIKAGMNGNVNILTATRGNVIAIPRSSVITKDGGYIVLVDTGSGTPEERTVTLGVTGENGKVEILSGLSEGEKIIAFDGGY
ncbi:MAG: efflux RND transporter periplasmic adaptor subunit [Patescibacteria group bacterium]|nr:efflux RND transporter periplasmic adaptor subunit [Patescibacteria group bacterium]